jgi:hypothetical protein
MAAVPASGGADRWLGGVRLLFGPLLLVACALLAQNGLEDEWSAKVVLGLAALGLVSAFLLRSAWRTLHDTLCSPSFATTLIFTIAAATALGTFVPQNATTDALEKRYGIAGAEWLERFFLSTVFTSFWFRGLIALLTLSLLLTVLRRPFWRSAYWGFTLSHVGMAVVVAGAAFGGLGGAHGMMALVKGKEGNAFLLGGDGPQQPLGFSLKLNDFEVEKYPDDIRFEVYRVTEGQEPKLLQTVKVENAREWTPLRGGAADLRVKEYYPDIEVRQIMRPGSGADLPAAASLSLALGGKTSEHWLVAGSSSADTAALNGAAVQFAWSTPQQSADAAWLQRTLHPQPARHVLEVDGMPGKLEVQPGGTYTLPGTQRTFVVREFFPDFCYDTEKKCGVSRSDQPRNPALLVEEPAAGAPPRQQFLFANTPGHGKKETLPLKYKYVPAAPPFAALVRIDGRTRQAVLASQGKELARWELVAGKPQPIELPPAPPAAGAQPNAAPQAGANTLTLELRELIEHAEPAVAARTLSQEPKNPGVSVELKRRPARAAAADAAGPRDTPAIQEAILQAAAGGHGTNQAILRVAQDTVVFFTRKAGEPRAYRSHVTVMDSGKPVKDAVIAVNSPLSYGGYQFYQSDWRAGDLNYSGLKVVSDPGLGIAYAGMIMICLGVLYVFYVRPRVRTASENGGQVA